MKAKDQIRFKDKKTRMTLEGQEKVKRKVKVKNINGYIGRK